MPAPVGMDRPHSFFCFSFSVLRSPGFYVEAGVDLGASFPAACEAAARFQTGTRCFGVDTWHGDPHAGLMDSDAVFEPLQKFVRSRYAGCELIRNTFDQAVDHFRDESIDLLHIDGFHTYEAVSHDFKTWRPKLSARSIVLLHDTEARDRDFGVWKLWAELKAQYRHFEFHHSYGLGVLFIGDSYPDELKQLMGYPAVGAEWARGLRSACERAAVQLPTRFREASERVPGTERLVMDKRGANLGVEARMRRNALCPCGSGRRYKHCHGRLA